jgi:hypothetical protein
MPKPFVIARAGLPSLRGRKPEAIQKKHYWIASCFVPRSRNDGRRVRNDGNERQSVNCSGLKLFCIFAQLKQE